MHHHKINLLCTRPVPETLISSAAKKNIHIDALSFIETQPVNESSLTATITGLSKQAATVIFTSMNAADAVAEIIGKQKVQWKIFCIGPATRDVVTAHFGAEVIAGTASDAGALAQVIIDSQITSAVFFCGDQRRKELPEKLLHHGISLDELVVYRTYEVPAKVAGIYDGILFFSPSAVHSFFSINSIAADTVLFAIGKTTASALKVHSGNVFVSDEPAGKEMLVEQAIAYFEKVV